MVKPPKTMQPEAVNLKKAGREANKAFGDDSFLNYMARKIDLQRKQFGLVLPPSPPSIETEINKESKGGATELFSVSKGSRSPIEMAIQNASNPNAKRKRFGISGIVKRLKKKHGELSQRPVLEEDVTADDEPTEECTMGLNSHSAPPENINEPQTNHHYTIKSNVPLQTEVNENSVNPQSSCIASLAKDGARRADLFFFGVVVLINGYTNPDAETLQRMLHKHGGDVEKYETSRVTHIIAEQLSTAKANMYKKQKRPRPVCRPAWITDSVEKGKKLSCTEYLLDDVRRESIGATKSVASFYVKNGGISNKTPTKNEHESVEAEVPQSDILVDRSTTLQQKDRFINGKVRTVGTDPKFLESFFASSRLSFIGSYKQRSGQSPTTRSDLSHRLEDCKRYVMHVDMDCFFASVVLRNFPEYQGKPVAISHHGLRKRSDASNRNVPENSSSECATSNYEARRFGIKKGMYLGRAKELCPSLIVLHYDFEGYEEVSEAVHEILLRSTSPYNGFVEQVSCDESYVEVHIPKATAEEPSFIVRALAETIRSEIYEATQCTATVGVACNKLMSKLATDHAKPNRTFLVEDSKALLRSLELHQLPGIGYHLRKKLENHKLHTVEDVWNRGPRSRKDLCEIIGKVNGEKVYGYCRGIDNRGLQSNTRKTIGAECNYGVRFDGPYGSDHMIRGLCDEVEKRMATVGVRCTKVILKIKQRKPDAPPPPKFLGHGSCFNHSKSGLLVGSATRKASELYKAVSPLFVSLGVSDKDIRGIGVVASGLVSDDGSSQRAANIHVEERGRIACLFDAHQKRTSPNRTIGPTYTESFHRTTEVKKAISRQNNDSSFILPTSSLVRTSQVDELPSTKRREVVAQMKSRNQKPRTAISATVAQSYRQTNVQRMLRLADLKSRPGDVSLTQLECLPLELQLQIANEDRGDTSCKASRIERRKLLPNSPLKEESIAVHIDPRSDDSFELEMSRPFAEFMDQNSALYDENLSRVEEFFLLCFSEGRFTDVTKLLRQLRHRSDCWREVYQRIFEVVDASMEQCTGARLAQP